MNVDAIPLGKSYQIAPVYYVCAEYLHYLDVTRIVLPMPSNGPPYLIGAGRPEKAGSFWAVYKLFCHNPLSLFSTAPALCGRNI